MNKKIEAIQNSEYFANIVITGGGTRFIPILMTHAGASRFVNEIVVPYCPDSMEEYLGANLSSSCSEEAAIIMAEKAYSKLPSMYNRLGISCTAALRTVRDRRGSDRAHIAIADSYGVKAYKVTFETSTREEQETELSEHLINIVYSFTTIRKSLLDITERRSEFAYFNSTNIEALSDNLIILAGSFNPLHDGHIKLLRTAEKITGKTGAFEISLSNVDKGKLDLVEADNRISQFKDENLIVCNAQLFIDKAKMFPSAWFVIGYDTAIRILDPIYNDVEEVLKTFRECGTKFLVGGRFHKGRFYTLDETYSVLEHTDIFATIKEADFREDISSSELRSK